MSRYSRSCFLALIVFCGALSSAQAQDAPVIARTQLQHWPDAKVKHRVLRQLESIVTLWPRYRKDAGDGQLLPVLTAWTKPSITATENLCESDEITLHFEPAGSAAQTADTPVRVSTIDATPSYRFLDYPASSAAWGATRSSNAGNICAKLRPDREAFFTASSEVDAVRGMWLTGIASAQARAAGVDFKLICDFPTDETATPAQCLQALAGMTREKVGNIGACADNALGHDAAYCVAILESDFEADIYQRFGDDDHIAEVVMHRVTEVDGGFER